jgi:putative colanic acid biosynthesis acetyltransferase WcaB
MMTELSIQIKFLVKDWRANRGNTKGRLIMMLYRFAKITTFFPYPIRLIFSPVRLIYTFFVCYLLGVDLPIQCHIGGGCAIYHGVGLVVHPMVIIGNNCILRHGVTIGERKANSNGVPLIGDNVNFGCGCIVLGDIVIGNGSAIGAGSLVIETVPDYSVVIGKASQIIGNGTRSLS